MIVGVIGSFDVITLFANLVPGLAFLKLVRILVEIIMLWLLSERKEYRRAKFEDSDDFKDVRRTKKRERRDKKLRLCCKHIAAADRSLMTDGVYTKVDGTLPSSDAMSLYTPFGTDASRRGGMRNNEGLAALDSRSTAESDLNTLVRPRVCEKCARKWTWWTPNFRRKRRRSRPSSPTLSPYNTKTRRTDKNASAGPSNPPHSASSATSSLNFNSVGRRERVCNGYSGSIICILASDYLFQQLTPLDIVIHSPSVEDVKEL